MKDLFSYMAESLLDGDLNVNTATMKKEINAWIKSNISKRGGRVKVSPKPNEDGQFIVSYSEHGKGMEIDFSNIPNYILLDIDLGIDGGQLTIKNAHNMSVLPKFKKFNVNALALRNSTCTLDSPQEESSMKTLYLQYGGKLSVELGDLSKVDLETVMTDCESCVDFTSLKNVAGFKSLHIRATEGSVYNLNGLKGEVLSIGRYDNSDTQATLTGKFNFNTIDIIMMLEVNGLPSNINKLADTWGNSLLTVKSVQEFVFGPWIDDIADQILTRLHKGALKIKTVTHYQAPYEEIPYDEFIHKLRMRYIKFAVLGDINKSKGHWDRITIDPDKFSTWAKSAKKYEIVSSGDDFSGKLYMILKDGAPIGVYIEDQGRWSTYANNILCTLDKQLMGEIVKL